MDSPTLYLILCTTLLVQTVALLLSWRQNRDENGLRDWGISAAMMTVGSLLIMLGLFFAQDRALTDLPPLARWLRDLGTVVAGAGWLLAWLGIRTFYHRRPLSYWLVPAFSLLLALALWPASHLPNWRVTLIGLSIVLFAGLITRELLRNRPERNLITYLASGAMGLVLLAWLVRTLWSASHLQTAAAITLIDQLCIYTSIVMSLVFTLSLILLTNERIHQRLRDQASVDALTGALNRRGLYESSRPLMARLRRDPTSIALAVLDLDYFKDVNDRYGHAAGDQVLKAFARQIQATLRDGDLFARHGGEEFVILFQDSTLEQARLAIDRLRDTWGCHPPERDDQVLTVSFSAGISSAHGPGEADLNALLQAADQALYKAKDAGRNCTRVSTMQPAAQHAASGSAGQA